MWRRAIFPKLTVKEGEVSLEVKRKLRHIVFLTDPKVLISEWIPFGRNHMIAFNDELDSFHGTRGTLLTDRVDRSPSKSTFETSPILTEVTVKNFDASRYVDFIARVYYPEVVEQIEEIGIHIEDTGFVLYGTELSEVAGRKPTIPLDHISRVISDMVQDTSVAMDTLLSTFQRRVLELVYFDKPKDRDKFSVLIANDIEPRLKTAEDYQDGEEKENEINQVVEIAYDFRDLDQEDKLFIGTHGIILISKNHKAYEQLISLYALVQSLSSFQSNLFTKLWTLWDLVKDSRKKLVEMGLKYLTKAQEELAEYRSDIILIDNITGYMREAVEKTRKNWSELKGKSSKAGQELAEVLEIGKGIEMVEERIDDINNVAEGLTNEIDGLGSLVNVLADHAMTNEARNIEYLAIFLSIGAILAQVFYGQPTMLLSSIALLGALLFMTHFLLRKRRA